MLAWLSVYSEVQTCIWPSWCHCHPKTPPSLASFKSRLVLPFWYRHTRSVSHMTHVDHAILVTTDCVTMLRVLCDLKTFLGHGGWLYPGCPRKEGVVVVAAAIIAAIIIIIIMSSFSKENLIWPFLACKNPCHLSPNVYLRNKSMKKYTGESTYLMARLTNSLKTNSWHVTKSYNIHMTNSQNTQAHIDHAILVTKDCVVMLRVLCDLKTGRHFRDTVGGDYFSAQMLV